MARTSEAERCARAGLELSLQLFPFTSRSVVQLLLILHKTLRCWPVFCEFSFIFSCRRWFAGNSRIFRSLSMLQGCCSMLSMIKLSSTFFDYPHHFAFVDDINRSKNNTKSSFSYFQDYHYSAFILRLPWCSAILFSFSKSTFAFSSKPFCHRKEWRFIQEKFASHVDCNIFATTIHFHNSSSPLSHFAGFLKRHQNVLPFLSSFYYFPFNEMRKWRRLKAGREKISRMRKHGKVPFLSVFLVWQIIYVNLRLWNI